MNKLIWFGVCLTVLLAVASCDQSGGELTQDFDRTGTPQKITVIVYDTKAQMQKALASFTEEQRDRELLGWARWSENETEGCEIHVVKIKHANNNSQMTTWGHELAHCMYGMFHE